MRGKLHVIEVDRRPAIVRQDGSPKRDERDRLDRQLRLALETRRRDRELGFAAALDLMAQQAELARGTRDLHGDEPTAPYPIIDPTVIEAD